MVRSAREKSASGIYHVMLRGINRQDIFCDAEDYWHFLEIVKRVKESGSCIIYGYCLMENHVHLLLCERGQELAVIMKRIGTSYAWWYNKKYDRVGHLFQNRFRSEAVETETYLLGVLRYIHHNPVKAKLSLTPDLYKWSSYQAYCRGQDDFGITDTTLVLNTFNCDIESAVKQFIDFMEQKSNEQFLDDSSKERKSDVQLICEIKELLNGQALDSLQSMETRNRNEIIQRIKGKTGVTQRQIARVTGLHPSIVFKA